MINAILLFIATSLIGLMFWVFLHIGFTGYVSKREYYGSLVGCFAAAYGVIGFVALLKLWF